MRPDSDLIRDYLAGDEAAFAELFERYKAPLFSYLLRMTGDRDKAEDLFQETFIKAVKALGRFGGEKKFSAWLFTIARNSLMDSFRRGKLRAAASLDDTGPDGEGPALGGALASAEPGPEAAALSAAGVEEFRRAFDSLPEEQKEVFLMRHYSGLSFREIAEAVGTPIGTVLARMSRAAAKLREKLKGLQ